MCPTTRPRETCSKPVTAFKNGTSGPQMAGNCLFKALADTFERWCTRYPRNSVAVHYQRLLASFDVDVFNIEPDDMRALAYMQVLVSTPEMDDTLAQWKMMSKTDLGAEYTFARMLPDDPKTLTPRDRRRFFETCMDRRLCWGEEFAISALEALLGCAIRVYDHRGRVMHDKPAMPVIVHITLHNAHYERKPVAPWGDSLTATDKPVLDNATYARFQRCYDIMRVLYGPGQAPAA